jgi:hypothetical protein
VPPSRPIALSDVGLQVLIELSRPLPPPDREAFLLSVAAELREHADPVGDGLLFRVAREVQRRYLRVPEPAEMRKQSQSRIAGARLHKPNGNGGG